MTKNKRQKREDILNLCPFCGVVGLLPAWRIIDSSGGRFKFFFGPEPKHVHFTTKKAEYLQLVVDE